MPDDVSGPADVAQCGGQIEARPVVDIPRIIVARALAVSARIHDACVIAGIGQRSGETDTAGAEPECRIGKGAGYEQYWSVRGIANSVQRNANTVGCYEMLHEAGSMIFTPRSMTVAVSGVKPTGSPSICVGTGSSDAIVTLRPCR